jgi:hypothetical protein
LATWRSGHRVKSSSTPHRRRSWTCLPTSTWCRRGRRCINTPRCSTGTPTADRTTSRRAEDHGYHRQGSPRIPLGRPMDGLGCGRNLPAVPVLVSDEVDAARAEAVEQLAFYEAVPSYQKVLAREGVTRAGQLAVIGTPAPQIWCCRPCGATMPLRYKMFGTSPPVSSARLRASLAPLPFHRPSKSGARCSRNAVMPSAASRLPRTPGSPRGSTGCCGPLGGSLR